MVFCKADGRKRTYVGLAGPTENNIRRLEGGLAEVKRFCPMFYRLFLADVRYLISNGDRWKIVIFCLLTYVGLPID
jgi:hypothetical protein